MSFAEKHNKTRIFEIETEGLEYLSPEEAFNEYGKEAVYRLDALFINRKGMYDDAPVAVVAINNYRFMLNMSAHMTEEVEKILEDSADIKDIKAGKVGIKLRPYHQKKFNRDCFGQEFVDIN